MELAVSLPILALILVGTIDFGRAFRLAMVVTEAARAGAQYGSYSLIRSVDSPGMVAAANAVLTANGLSPGATASYTCSCLDDLTGDLIGTPSSASCTAVPACAAGNHLAVDVTVTVTQTFSLSNPFPGIPDGLTIARSAAMRAVP